MNIVLNVLVFASLALALPLASTGLASDGEQPADRGSYNPLIIIKQELGKQLRSTASLMTQPQRTSAIRIYELQLREARSLFLSKESYAKELNDVGYLYWQNRSYDEAVEAFMTVARNNPETLVSADAYFMLGCIEYGNRGRPAEAIEPLAKSVEVLKNLPGGADNDGRNELAARALNMLGDVYMINGRYEDAARQYEYFLAHEDIVKAADPASLINANAEWARILVRQGRLEEASARYEKMDELVRRDSNLPASVRLGLLQESIRVRTKSIMNKDHMIRLLEELWRSEKESKELELLRIGNDLSLYYYFSENPIQNGKFMNFSTELLEKSNEIYAAHGKAFTKDQKQTYESIVKQSLLMQIHAFTGASKKEQASRVKRRFMDKFSATASRFKPLVTTAFPKEIYSTLMSYHKKYIVSTLKNPSQKRGGGEQDKFNTPTPKRSK